MKERLARVVVSGTQNLESPAACEAATDVLSALTRQPESLSNQAKVPTSIIIIYFCATNICYFCLIVYRLLKVSWIHWYQIKCMCRRYNTNKYSENI